MPLVTLLFPDGEAGPERAVPFDVAPRTGEVVLLNLGGKRRLFLIDEAFHGMTSDGAEIVYFARLRRPDGEPVAPRHDAPSASSA